MKVVNVYYIIDNSGEFYFFYFNGLLSLKRRHCKKSFYLREINLADALILYEKKYFV